MGKKLQDGKMNSFIRKMSNIWKRQQNKGSIILIGIVVGLALLMFFVLVNFIYPICSKANEIGIQVGTTTGNVAGVAVGSYYGITQKVPDGLHDGKEKGLSAEDIQIDVSAKIKEIGKLEVLTAGVTLDDKLKIADNYNAIYLYKADAVFTVDVKNADITAGEDKVSITLDLPSIDVYFNENETEKISEWQRHFYSGKTADGYIAYINSRAKIEKEAPEKIKNDDTLMQMAKEAAKKQTEILVKSICGNDKIVEINFKEKGNNYGTEREE